MESLIINDIEYTYREDTPIKVPLGELDIKLTKKYYHDFLAKATVTPNDNLDSIIIIQVKPKKKESLLTINTSTPGESI